MTRTLSSSSSKQNQLKTPNSKQKLHFNNNPRTPFTPNPHHHHPPTEHPVEVIARVRNDQDQDDKNQTFFQINQQKQSIRVRADNGYRDFSLDGVSLSEEEDIDEFYDKFVKSRVNGVKLGNKCTVMMYGPTGSGKSYTMFGCVKEAGIVYRALKDILGEDEKDFLESGLFVQVTILEIYNEEIYDLLLSNGGGGIGFGWPKGGVGAKAKLDVMGKKAKNATFILGTEAAKISKEIQKVEKRRIVKSTLCNERSSRSHCIIILDVPRVGGRLMLVDMAGSENIEQAGQTGLEAKMQTAKINQGNIALKRVVESIANGDSHVPFRDSKLTMLLQDSFEDDKSKILMILCANPHPKEIHKTICTLEYGAKAKCIVRGPHTPIKDKFGTEESSTADGSKIVAMNQLIIKLQMENKLRETERNEAQKLLLKREDEVSALRAKLEINMKVNEQTEMLKRELEKKLKECERMTEEFVEIERRIMEERILQQQEEVEVLRKRLEEIELELVRSKDGKGEVRKSRDLDGITKTLMRMYGDEDPGMVKSMDLSKSMDLDMDDPEPLIREVHLFDKSTPGSLTYSHLNPLSTVYEEDEFEEEEDEVEKEIIQEKRVCTNSPSPGSKFSTNISPSSRRVRIQNIFTLCGNQRELCQHIRSPLSAEKIPNTPEALSSLTIKVDDPEVKKSSSKENYKPTNENGEHTDEMHVVGLNGGGGPMKDKENCLKACSLAKGSEGLNHHPLSPLSMNQMENTIPVTPLAPISQCGDILSPTVAPHLSSTPFITLRRHLSSERRAA
ncbi:hypothetical protein ACFE04_014018 [Oxalis oulophora]